MRILVISNFYPPARLGGYTQWCHEVALELAERGHDVFILTSRDQIDIAPVDPRIRRVLHLDGDLLHYHPLHFFTSRRRHARENQAFLLQTLDEVRPDIVFVWGMWALSRWVPAWAEAALPGKVVYFLSDYWPAEEDFHHKYWTKPANHILLRLPKMLLNALAIRLLETEGEPELGFEHAICVSDAVRSILETKDVPLQNAVVIHGGSDVDRFDAPSDRSAANGHVSLLYAGQLVPHKGVHTAIEAVGHLTSELGMHEVSLTVVGTGTPSYERDLRRLAEHLDLEEFVSFAGPLEKSDMPAEYARHDILLFPSVYEEPLARVTQEAMASGMAVVGTTTGGTGEILKDGRTGLTFAAGDSQGLARQVARLIRDPQMRRKIAEAGRQTILEQFTLDRMVDEIEAYLKSVASRKVVAS